MCQSSSLNLLKNPLWWYNYNYPFHTRNIEAEIDWVACSWKGTEMLPDLPEVQAPSPLYDIKIQCNVLVHLLVFSSYIYLVCWGCKCLGKKMEMLIVVIFDYSVIFRPHYFYIYLLFSIFKIILKQWTDFTCITRKKYKYNFKTKTNDRRRQGWRGSFGISRLNFCFAVRTWKTVQEHV